MKLTPGVSDAERGEFIGMMAAVVTMLLIAKNIVAVYWIGLDSFQGWRKVAYLSFGNEIASGFLVISALLFALFSDRRTRPTKFVVPIVVVLAVWIAAISLYGLTYISIDTRADIVHHPQYFIQYLTGPLVSLVFAGTVLRLVWPASRNQTAK